MRDPSSLRLAEVTHIDGLYKNSVCVLFEPCANRSSVSGYWRLVLVRTELTNDA